MSNTRNDLADLSESTLTSDADPKDVFRKPKETPVFHGGKQVCNRYTVDEIMQPIIIHVLFP